MEKIDKNTFKKIALVIFWLALIVLAIYYFGIRKTKEEINNEQLDKQEQISEAKNKEIINNLIAKYNAIEYKDDLENQTTLSLQNILPNNQPMAFTSVSIDDIFMRNGKYYITATPRFLFENVFIELECSKEIADSINDIISLTNKNPYDDTDIQNRFALVATITDVSKPQFKATSYNDDGYNTGIEIDSDSDIFLLKGKCVDIINY